MPESKIQNAGAQPRRRYDAAYKRRAVELSERGDRTIQEVARELGLKPDALYRWRTEQGVTSRPEIVLPNRPRSVPELEAENRELRQTLADMEQREIILKKSLGILSPAPGRSMPKWTR
jgi:transposase